MTKEELEIEKLRIEVDNLKKPFFKKFNGVAIIIPAACILVTYILNKDYMKQSLDLDTKRLELKKIQLDSDVNSLKALESGYKKNIDTLTYQINVFQKEANDWKLKYEESISNRIKLSQMDAQKAPVAENSYNQALSFYKKGEYAKAQEKCAQTLKIKPNNDYIVTRSLILSSRINIAMGKKFQAKATLNSVIDNYEKKPEDKEDLIKSAKSTLKMIEK